MEITEATRGIFNLNRVLGLAPYMIQKSPSSGNVEIKRSIFLCIYSFSLLVILGFSTYWGLFRMTDLKAPARVFFRTKSETSKVVTAMDVSVVALASFTGMICGLIGLRPTLETNRRLKEIDEALAPYTSEVKDRFRAYMMMSPTLLFLTFLIGLDLWTWNRLFEEIREKKEKSDEPQPEEGFSVQWYFPFYTLYYILTALHINFAQSVIGLGRRYHRLNTALKNSFHGDAKFCDGVYPVALVRNVTANKSLDVLSSIQGSQKVSLGTKQSLINGSGPLMDRLARIHASLRQCIRNTSRAFGMAVLFLMISCLLHLVATAYFLLQELLETRNSAFFWLQTVWIIYHSLLLLMIVEPCHVTTEEATKTLRLLCRIQQNCTDISLQESMRKFWQQLLSDKAGFSACGMCKIDRQILTSENTTVPYPYLEQARSSLHAGMHRRTMTGCLDTCRRIFISKKRNRRDVNILSRFSSAITTYLVILIQFQQSTNDSK